MPIIRIKRIYEKPVPQDGERFLVDRIWPRGVGKEKAKLSGWIRELAPSTSLRAWFRHEVPKWVEFKKRYLQELHLMEAELTPLLKAARKGKLTLLYAAKDEEHNNAVVLRNFLASKLKG